MLNRLGKRVTVALFAPIMFSTFPAYSAVIFQDDFERASNSAVGNGWNEIEKDASDTLYVAWRTSPLADWSSLFEQSLGGSDFASVINFALGPLAADQAALQLRFYTDVSAGTETAYLDNVVLRGSAASVPEPSVLAMLGLGLLGLGFARRGNRAG